MEPHDPPSKQQSHARSSPAALRNRGVIAEVLARVLPPQGRVLEIASGTGEHAVSFAAAFPGVSWQPTDVEPEALASIAARVDSEGPRNLLQPLRLDVTAWPWPVTEVDAIVCINMIHISPWAACEALMAGAGRVLPVGGVLYLYGAIKFDGRHTAPSNEAFDADLRARDPAWGVRDEADVRAAAAAHGLQRAELVAMPANNFSLVFRKS
ncbi:DUF938 domain-containing protein [Nannocystis punicea]|uniref:DUF938 domain-containing protein n=1 Tax=Nannocystis punicea TaxID=2995304 RepID=A0ABY7H4X3_9BACT|nr:DUF938 domain-containing protein [Nannocystis poenicansa]WAS94317.1 DUF938 domain-containing protein [Nannocystis poenicansa]